LRPDTAAARVWARQFDTERVATVYEQSYNDLREAPAGSALEYVCALAYVDPARGVTLLVQAQRLDPITCRLVVHLGGPGQHAGRPALLGGPGGLAQEDVTDERGVVSFFLPIVALAQIHLSLSLEPEHDLK